MGCDFDMFEAQGEKPSEELPCDLSGELGEILRVELKSPGVYYLSVKKDDAYREVYLVTPEAPAISQKARGYGEALREHSDLRIYELCKPGSGWHIIDFEVCRYLMKCHLPSIKTDDTLYTCALYGAEEHPEYFGYYPVPLYTPRGRTVRHRIIINGVYWLETERCEELLAVCYPLWSADILVSEHTQGEQLVYDRMQGIDNTRGYLFFPGRGSAIPLYALSLLHEEIRTNGVVDIPALRNAVCTFFPEFASMYNAYEASYPGGGILTPIPGASTDFIGF